MIMGKGITAATLAGILSLPIDERNALAKYFRDEQAITEEVLTTDFSMALENEAREQCAENAKQAEALKGIPAAVWAAHALEEINDHVYSLSVVCDAAKETATANMGGDNLRGHYLMFLRAVDEITETLLKVFTDKCAADVIWVVADQTGKPDLE